MVEAVAGQLVEDDRKGRVVVTGKKSGKVLVEVAEDSVPGEDLSYRSPVEEEARLLFSEDLCC